VELYGAAQAGKNLNWLPHPPRILFRPQRQTHCGTTHIHDTHHGVRTHELFPRSDNNGRRSWPVETGLMKHLLANEQQCLSTEEHEDLLRNQPKQYEKVAILYGYTHRHEHAPEPVLSSDGNTGDTGGVGVGKPTRLVPVGGWEQPPRLVQCHEPPQQCQRCRCCLLRMQQRQIVRVHIPRQPRPRPSVIFLNTHTKCSI